MDPPCHSSPLVESEKLHTETKTEKPRYLIYDQGCLGCLLEMY